MTKNQRLTLTKFLTGLFFVVPNIFRIIRNLIALIGMEAKIAEKNLILIITLAWIAGSIVTTLWICLNALLVVYLNATWHLNWMGALGIACLINLIVLTIISVVILKAKDKLTFPETRRQVKNLVRLAGRDE